MRLKRIPCTVALLAAALAAAGILGACDKMPLVAPSGTVITLYTTTNALPSNGATDITAVLIENGTTSTGTTTGGAQQQQATTTPGAGTPVHNGTLVTFTTTLGRVDPAEARTTNGKATVRLIADGRSGVATVTAISGGANNHTTVNVGSAAATRILVTANPQGLPATGGTSTIAARVEDGQGNGISGVPVSFSTTAGTLGSGTVVTDANGIASTTLLTTAAATVTVSAGGSSSGTNGTVTPTTLTATVAITLSPNIALGLSPQAGAITVGAPMTFTVSVGATPVLTDVVLNFGDGDRVDLGALSANTTVPHIYGGVTSFTASATATAADGTVKTVSSPVVVTDYTVTLTFSPANPSLANPTTFTAAVTPNTVSISDYVFDFGDGTVVHTSSPQIQHTFSTAGPKTVQVTVVPTKGPAHTAIVPLNIS